MYWSILRKITLGDEEKCQSFESTVSLVTEIIHSNFINTNNINSEGYFLKLTQLKSPSKRSSLVGVEGKYLVKSGILSSTQVDCQILTSCEFQRILYNNLSSFEHFESKNSSNLPTFLVCIFLSKSSHAFELSKFVKFCILWHTVDFKMNVSSTSSSQILF